MQILHTHKTDKFRVSGGVPRLNTMKYIILHHTGPGSDSGLLNYLCYRDSQSPTNYQIRKNTVSCQYYINSKGKVYELAKPERCCRHAGKSSWGGLSNLNIHSVGIEIASDGNSFTSAQKKATRELVEYLMKYMGVSHKEILRHKDIAPGRKVDVGDSFWNKEYSSYSQYQDSYKSVQKVALSSRDAKYRKAAMILNSYFWGVYKDEKFRKAMNEANEAYRSTL